MGLTPEQKWMQGLVLGSPVERLAWRGEGEGDGEQVHWGEREIREARGLPACPFVSVPHGGRQNSKVASMIPTPSGYTLVQSSPLCAFGTCDLLLTNRTWQR